MIAVSLHRQVSDNLAHPSDAKPEYTGYCTLSDFVVEPSEMTIRVFRQRRHSKANPLVSGQAHQSSNHPTILTCVWTDSEFQSKCVTV